MWRELRSVKTKFDGKLANCILAGIENPTQKIGVYACDEEAYSQFKKLFEPIIKELHEYDMKSGALIRHNFDINNLEWGKLERTKQCIKFVQVTASRNIKGYPFAPILDSLTKCEIESKLSKILVEDIDAKIAINKMSVSDKKKFSDEGLLFDKHPSIESIVPSSKWSEGCSIYYNNDLSHVIWVNADDHVQFFITQKAKPDFKQACDKLFYKLKLLESHSSLCTDSNLGYLTCNPAYLGTALRIKAIVQLQKASDSQIKFELLKNFCTQQGVDLKHATQNTYEFTLNKTFQLGKTEAEMVGGFVNSLAEILRVEETVIVMEEEMLKKKVKEETEKALKDMPKFDEINTSLIRPFINEEIWLKLGRTPTTLGHSLKECVKPGVANHKIGIIALDADCYIKFEELFMSVIKMYHEDYALINYPMIPSDTKAFCDTIKKFDSIPAFTGGYLMWQGNMKDLSFPAGVTKKTRDECFTKLVGVLDPFIKQQNLVLTGVDEIEEITTMQIYTDLINEKNKIQELTTEWPEGRKILRTPNNKLMLLTNILNHLAITVTIDPKTMSSDILLFLSTFDALMTKNASLWSFSDKIGFYSTIPTDIGNGFTLKLSIKMHNSSHLAQYMPYADSKHVILSFLDNAMYFTHKHKFKNFYQCIIDVFDVASNVVKQEEEKEAKAKEEQAKKEAAENAKKNPPPESKGTEPMVDIKKTEVKKDEVKKDEPKEVKKDEPKKEELKKEEPKKEEPKKTEVKKDEPPKEVKKEEPPKEVKKEEPPKEVKKEEPPKEVKKEEPPKEVKKDEPKEVKKEEVKKEDAKKLDEMPAFPATHKGVIKTVITPELFKECDVIKAPNGVTFGKIMEVSIANPNDRVGIFIESVDSLVPFTNLYANTFKLLSKGSYNLLTENMNLENTNLLPIDIAPPQVTQ